MANPDFFEQLAHDPESLSSHDLLINGAATVKASLEQYNLGQKDAVNYLIVGMFAATQGLNKIRTSPDVPELEKRQSALTVLVQPETYRLFPLKGFPNDLDLYTVYRDTWRDYVSESYRTLAAGFRTQAAKRRDELVDDMCHKFLELGCTIRLGAADLLNADPLSQLEHLSQVDVTDPDQKRLLQQSWARRLAPTVRDETFIAMVEHFMNQGDAETAAMIGVIKIAGLPKPVGEHQVDFLANIPWYKLN